MFMMGVVNPLPMLSNKTTGRVSSILSRKVVVTMITMMLMRRRRRAEGEEEEEQEEQEVWAFGVWNF
jgi:hypothetical protein